MSSVIAGFKGKYRWLSNFERCEILYKGILYGSTEAAYQAQKLSPDKNGIKVRHIFSKLDAREAKALGRVVQIREDWDDVKLQVMEDVCRIKFNLPKFKQLLLTTKDAEIVESNWWGDTFWGVCNGVGENHLGEIIMDIREEIKESVRVDSSEA